MPLPVSARCAKHVEAAAVDICQRCGTFVCGDCSNIREEDVYCASCAPLMERRSSARPIGALLIAVSAVLPFLAGVAPIFLLVFPALSLALQLSEASARRSNQTAAGGVAYPLAWVVLVFVALAIAFLVVLSAISIPP